MSPLKEKEQKYKRKDREWPNNRNSLEEKSDSNGK